jgi:hypothetical protein
LHFAYREVGRELSSESEITGPPEDNFEVWEITREEYEEFRPLALTQISPKLAYRNHQGK